MIALDAALVLASVSLAFWLHGLLRPLVPLLRDPPAFPQYALLVFLAMPLFVAVILVLGAHRSFERAHSELRLVWDLIRVHAGVLAGLALLGYLTQSVINRSIVGLFLLCTFLLLWAERAVLGRWQRFQHATGQGRQRVLLVGTPGPALLAFVLASARDAYPPEFVGYLDPTGAPAPAGLPLTLLGDPSRLEAVLRQDAVDRVLFFPPVLDGEATASAVRLCDSIGVPVGFALATSPVAGILPRVDELAGMPFVSLERAPKPPGALAVKHAVDFLAAGVGLLLLSPLLLLVALAILLTMGRPVLFLQERAGLHGRRFRMLKFRTMVKDAEDRKPDLLVHNELSGPVFKLTQDPRVTRLGRVLRKTSVDELPQLANVFLGQMSLIGPRPLPVGEQERIKGWHRRRLSMKPGITGLWQVNGRNNVDFEQWMALDLEYIDRWTLGLDARILLKTVPVVLVGRGAR